MSVHLRRTTFAVIALLLGTAIALLLGTALLPAAPARAQCMFPTHLYNVPFCSDGMNPTMPSMTYRICFAQLHTPIANPMLGMTNWGCIQPMVPTDSSNVTVCSFIVAQQRLYARRPLGGTMTAFCQATCTACGLLRVDVGDRLPVELMDFSVDDGGFGDEDREPHDRSDAVRR